MPMINVSNFCKTSFSTMSGNYPMPSVLAVNGKHIPFGTPLFRIDENGNVEGCIVTGFFYDCGYKYARAAGHLARSKKDQKWAFSVGSISTGRLNIGLYSTAEKALDAIAKYGTDEARKCGDVTHECGVKGTREILERLGFNVGNLHECGSADGVFKWEWDGQKAVPHFLDIDCLWADELGYHCRCDAEAGLELYTHKADCERAHTRVIGWDDKNTEAEAKVEIDVKVSVKGELLAESKTEIKAKLAELKDLGIDLVGLV